MRRVSVEAICRGSRGVVTCVLDTMRQSDLPSVEIREGMCNFQYIVIKLQYQTVMAIRLRDRFVLVCGRST